MIYTVSLKIKSLINYMAYKQMKEKEMEKWIYEQMMYAYGADTMFDYMKTRLTCYKIKD